MVLVDSSVWVQAEHNRIIIANEVPEGQTVAVCPIVFQEVLRGTQSPRRYRTARRVLLAAEMLDSPMPLQRFEEAANIYLVCRDAGVTVRSSADCLVAATALAHDATVMYVDRDFTNIARVLPLKTLNLTRS